jgi:hypothetical protein
MLLINRITGNDYNGTYHNNYANSAMTVTANGSPVTITPDLNTEAGANATMATLKTLAFYNTPSNWYRGAWSIDEISNPQMTWQICNSETLPFFQRQDITCGGTTPAVNLALTVFLEGPTIAGPAMTAHIQDPTYFPAFYPNFKLPTTSPYSEAPATYAQVNNPAGVAGVVVDWILVEIWGNITGAFYFMYDVLEAQSLLLKSDGSIVDVNGNVPQFAPQTGRVHIVIKHRNHLAVMSNPVADFGADIVYNFSTAGQAYQYYSSEPMKPKHGVYCMYAGDILGSGSIDLEDKIAFLFDLNSGAEDGYFDADFNMDGVVDLDDKILIQINIDAGIDSPVIYFEKR